MRDPSQSELKIQHVDFIDAPDREASFGFNEAVTINGITKDLAGVDKFPMNFIFVTLIVH